MMDMENLPELEVVLLGESKISIVPKSDSLLNKSSLPLGPPPVLPSLTEQLEEFLNSSERLSIYDLEKAQRFIPRKANPSSLFTVDLCPLQTTLKAERDMTTGKIIKFTEVVIQDRGFTPQNSTSLKRMPDKGPEIVKGDPKNFPFWPGGFEEPSLEILKADVEKQDIDFVNDLLTIPPGFESGMVFDEEKENLPPVIKLSDILDMEDLTDVDLSKGEPVAVILKDDDMHKEKVDTPLPMPSEDQLDSVLSQVPDVLKISETKITKVAKTTEWAIEVDISNPVDDFHQRIPNMAFNYDFELDIFQKQAILHLENKDSVFVAAHTSAGKTVVAEYAIALSTRNMTKAVYTSPIKALSNQKYRDFKSTFSDVGLLTGDVQINKTASCLIMTTEILRSMLYNGSEVIRNLEWVIFDEVHYINDSERGVVWEEVLIMLPSHVKLVLLSATVPNTMELADWIGRIKQKTIYVISTLKRPVPLEHYLYTGSGGKSKNEIFIIIDSLGNFKTSGYNSALAAKQERTSKHQQSYGAKGCRTNVMAKQDKNIYIGLIEYLRQDDKLPVVCFTLSRRRCDDNANMLSTVDLTTKGEKGEIHKFIETCISKLTKSDRKLPQVVTMQQLLKQGLGVHHSGILPILKEVVEMLFQRGLIKVLFATETFAMGINMPTRTVVFDSVKKHDGCSFRELLPSEYIQMAGRAGRRGKDKKGMVIILCKADIPELSTFSKMMQGKPTKLESKFRLTYSMILNLLKVHNENLRVEDMMKRSFREANSQRTVKTDEDKLKELVTKFNNLQNLDCGVCQGDIKDYCTTLQYFIRTKTKLLEIVCSGRFGSKVFCPGRVLTVNTSHHKNVIAVILSFDKKGMKVMSLSEKNEIPVDDHINYSCNEISNHLIPWSQKMFIPEGALDYVVLFVTLHQIQQIFSKVLKIEVDPINTDWEKRQHSKNYFPNENVAKVVTKMRQLAEENDFSPINLMKECNVKDIEFGEKIKEVERTSEVLGKYNCLTCMDFLKHFSQTCEEISLEKQMKNYKLKLSEKSLQLLPEYQARIKVLQKLGYIDKSKTTEMKGKVACAMSNHEILLTELLVDDIFKSLTPEEIAALLSCTVYQQKTQGDEIDKTLPECLRKGKKRIMDIIQYIGETQVECGLQQSEMEFIEQYNFDLCNVVYEWAKGMPFCDIMDLTDVQEGIIVRCIQRLEEILKDVHQAAHTIGNPDLERKTEKASQLIKRDIVFAASLYTQ